MITDLKYNRNNQTKKNDGFALVSLISSILGLALLLLMLTEKISPTGIVLFLFGLVSGIIGLVRIKKKPELRKGRGFAIMGIVISGLFVLYILFVIGLLIFLGIWLQN